MVDRPGVILSFDDGENIGLWCNAVSLFDDLQIKATFYVSCMNSLTEMQWAMLRNLQRRGHVIGHHGVNHRRAGEVTKERDPNNKRLKNEPIFKTWQQFLAADIDPGLKAMAVHGLSCKHYSYPYGNCNEESHKVLLQKFKTLRRGGRGQYPISSFPSVYSAFDFSRLNQQGELRHLALLEQSLKKGSLVAFYMHKPLENVLRVMADVVQKYNSRFYTIEDVT